MRIAVVGSGAAGAMSAWLLQGEHEVVLFESEARPGGHANTIAVDVGGRAVPVELGAEFFFQEGYSGFHAVLERLGVGVVREKLAVSISMDNGRPEFALPPRDLAGLRSILSPATIRDLIWMQRLAAAAERVAADGEWGLSVAKLIERTRIPADVANNLVIPLIAASWGVTREVACELAAYSVVRVMGLRLRHEPHTFRFEFGLSTYIARLLEDSPRLEVRLGSPVVSVDPVESGLVLATPGSTDNFDAVVLACDWHNSARICASSARLAQWHRAFGAFPDTEAHLAVHTDTRYLPTNRKIWGTANFALTTALKPRTTVWSGKRAGVDLFRTWLRDGEEPPPSTSHTAKYRHIVVSTEHPRRQAELARLQGTAGVWAAGMYTDGIDNHESALRSAVRVAERLNPQGERVRWFAPLVSS
jgi:predicted NAD/FAD-binding protein